MEGRGREGGENGEDERGEEERKGRGEFAIVSLCLVPFASIVERDRRQWSSGFPPVKKSVFPLTQYQNVTDRQTDRQTDRRKDISAIAIPALA